MNKLSLPCVLGALMSTTMVTATIAQDTAIDAAPSYVAPELYAPNWSDKGIATIADQLSGTWASSDADIAMGDCTSRHRWHERHALCRKRPLKHPLGAISPSSLPALPLQRRNPPAHLWSLRPVRSQRVSMSACGPRPKCSLQSQAMNSSQHSMLNSKQPTTASPAPPHIHTPTGVAGAVEMTSSLTLDGDTLNVADRGFDADGNVVWGADADSVVSFVRSDPYASVNRRDDGMIIVEYAGDAGILPQNGDQLHVHYHGFLADGSRFDSSYARNQAFIFEFPPENRAITGWGHRYGRLCHGHPSQAHHPKLPRLWRTRKSTGQYRSKRNAILQRIHGPHRAHRS